MISRILMSLLTLLVATSMYAQVNTYYVREDGDDNADGLTPGTAKATIQAAAYLINQIGDIIDVGPGQFEGAALGVETTILGANAYTPWDAWGDETRITSTMELLGNGNYVFEGLTFGEFVRPVSMGGYYGYPNAVTVSNCRFDGSRELWIDNVNEVVIAANRFEGRPFYDANAVTISGVYGSATVGENTFQDYATGLLIYGSIGGAYVSYNDFLRSRARAIIVSTWNSIDGIYVSNNMFAGGDDVNLLAVEVNNFDNVNINVTRNSFGFDNGNTWAVRNNSSPLLAATCNYFGTNDVSAIIARNIGSIDLGPYNSVGTDIDGGAIGFVPDPNEECATEAPVKTSTDYARGFFSIQSAIDASAAGATIRAQKGTYSGDLSVNKSLTIIGSHEPFTKDGAGNYVWTFDATDARSKSADAAAWTVINGNVNLTGGAGDVVLNAVRIDADLTSKPLNVSATRSVSVQNTRINARHYTYPSIPAQSAITLNRAASFTMNNSVVGPEFLAQGEIRALTCAIGNLSRNITITNSNILGSLEFRGLSSTSTVTIANNKIESAGTDGIALIGNTIRTFTIENNEITNANQHGIAFRNASSFGTALKVKNNTIHNYDNAGSGFAALYFSASASGTVSEISDNNLDYNDKGLINDNANRTYPLSCQWWGTTSGNTILTKVTGNATVENWLVDGTDTSPATGFQPLADRCLGTFVTLSLASQTNIKCNGAATGAIDMTRVGGSAPFTYAWTGPNGYTGNTLDITGLKAGLYTLTATDTYGTFDTYEVELTEPALLVVESASVTSSYSGSQLSCNGAMDGQISVTAMGGVEPYMYSKDDGATYQVASVFDNLGAGTYAMRVKDANDCVTPATNVTITAPPALVITSAPKKSYNGSDLSCNGATDGEITVNATGGTGAKEYSNDNGASYQPSNVFANLPAGTYQLRVRDVNACTTAVTSVTITAPPVLAITGTTKKSYNGSDLSCNGAADGQITVDATGGTGTKQYSKDNGANYQASNVFANLGAGTYQIRVKDVNGCQTLATSVTITAPPVLQITGTTKKLYNGSELSCNGATDGQITVAAVGGTGNKQYSKDNGSTYQSSNAFANLGAGTYQIRVRDTNNCVTAATSVTITAPPALVINSATKKSYNGSDLSCNGATDGQITVSAAGGTGVKQYSNDNGATYQASNVFGGLGAGTYQIRVRDDNGCTTLATSVTITAPPTLSITSATKKSYNGSDVTCNGATNGEITVVATGGTGTKQYSKDNGASYQASNVFAGLGAGTYQIRVKDVNGCETPATTVTVVNPPVLTITQTTKKLYNGSELSCNGATDGEITVAATGGTGTKQYSKDNGSTYQASNVFAGLGAGTYQMRVKDVNGCETPATSVTITAPPVLEISGTTKKSYNGADLSCNGATDGQVTVSALGGTGTKQYSNNNGSTYQASNVFGGLGAGTYLMRVKDANGCETPATSVIISAPPTLSIVSTTKKNYNGADLTCAGATDGEITVAATGGTGSKQYSKDNGATYQGSNVFGGLGAGTYQMRVKDANGCETPATSVTIVAPAQLVITQAVKKKYNGADVTCNGATDGEITVSATGGTGTKQYSKDNGATYQASNIFSNLGAGNYSIRVKDVNGCETPATSVTITNPTSVIQHALQIKKYNGSDVSCFGAADGEIRAYATGGTGTIEYSINNGPWQVSDLFTGLAAGNYTIRARDANGCLAGNNTNATLVNPPMLVLTSAPKKSYAGADLSCANATDGQITVNAVGGTGTKQYSKDNGSTYQASNLFTGLGAGTYQMRVKDANGCETPATSVTITAPPVLSITGTTKKTYNGAELSCNGATDGQITVNAAGGTGTKEYSKDGGATYQASNVFAALGAGTYAIWVRDVNGCTANTTVTITAPQALTVQSALKKSYNGSDVSCAGATDGKITVTPAGGTGTILFSKDNGANYQASNEFPDLAPATYSIRVKDANGCESPAVSVTIQATQALSANAVKKSYNGADVRCATSADGRITVNATGGTGTLEYSNNGGVSYQASNIFDNLAPGTYAIKVRDLNECAITTNVTLVAPPALTVSVDEIAPKKTGESLTFSSTVGGGTGDYAYKWTSTAASFADPGNVGEWTIASGVENNTGTYTLSVKDANGCETSTSIDVIVYGTTVWVNGATGSDDNRGNAALPLKTIQKGIDVTSSGNTINVAAGTYGESPTLPSARTIQGTGDPTLGSSKYFVYSTGDSVTINGFASATFNTVGAGSADGIYKALNKLNADGTLRIESGSYTIGSTINIYSGVTVRGADVDMTNTCALDPASAIVGSSTGLVLIKFHGSAAKTVSDIKLQVGDATGRLLEIASGSSGNVSTERVLFANASGVALYGVTNPDRSAGVVYDVAKLVNDKNDFGFGNGEVKYGKYAPLPVADVAAGWKAEDANTATQAALVSTLSAYVGTNIVNASIISSKPKFYSDDADVLNGRAHLSFDGGDFMDASTSATVNGGDEKTLFVAFRTGVATANDMVVYKHGDEDQGISVVVDSDENIELNIYEDGEVETLEYAATANTEYIAQIYFNGTSDDGDAADPRVGFAIDNVDGQVAETKIVGGTTGFEKTTLTTPGIATASKISLGGRVGSVYMDGAEIIGTTRGNYFNGAIGEVIILNTSDKATRDAVYCYLRNKFFDADHQGSDNDLERRDEVVAGEDVAGESLLSAFPNPADDEFQIEAVVATGGQLRVTLHDAIGREVMSLFDGVVPNNASLPLTASVRDLPSGAYVVRMVDASGNATQTPIMIRH